ncbi:MAG: DnaA/Hda family protein, partial [Deltaproteobacteria bacterium]|nr:DnaA/Hda family protein [Deltaproteobacteria bacterium]
MNRLDKQWDFCKALLGQQIGAEDSAAWLHSMRLEEILPGKVVFSGVPNSFFRNRILHQFRSLLLTTLGESFPEVALNPEPSLELRIGPHPVSGGAVPETPPNGTVTETVLGESIPMLAPARKEPAPVLNSKDTALTGRFRFEDFFTSPANASAVHFMREVVAQPGQRYNPLMLVGPSGLGKTHLLQAVANALRARHPEWPVLYRTGESFKNEVLEAITRRRTAPLRELFHTAQVLLLDDLEFMLVSPRAQEELMHLLDHLHRRGRQVIVSADRMPMLMTALGEP